MSRRKVDAEIFAFSNNADRKTTPPSATPPHGADFHEKMVSLADAISKECTKLVFMFSSPPPPTLEECGLLSRQLEQATLQLVTTFYQLDVALGKVFLCIQSKISWEWGDTTLVEDSFNS